MNRSLRISVRCYAERLSQACSSQSMYLAYVDQSYTGCRAANAAKTHGIGLEMIQLPEVKCGFVLLLRRRTVESSFTWIGRCRLSRDHEATTNSAAATVHVRRLARPL